MSNWPNNKLARRALLLLRKHGAPAGSELWPLVWEFVHSSTGGKFSKVSDYVCADMATTEEEQARDAVLRVVIQAVESGDHGLLEPSNTFAVTSSPGAPAGQASQPPGIKT